MNTGFIKKQGAIAFAIALLFTTLPAWALTATQMAKLLASDGAAYDYFGYSVAIDVDTAVVGSPLKGSYSGSAYVFTRDVSGIWGLFRYGEKSNDL